LVKVNKIQYENLKDYDIHNTNPKNRREQVVSKLTFKKKNFPEQFKSQLTELCTKYSDVFGLEAEPISTDVKDDEPIYKKHQKPA